MDAQNVKMAYLAVAMLFFLFLVYTAFSAERYSSDILSPAANEAPSETRTLKVYSVAPTRTSSVTGVMDGDEISANRLEFPNCATSRRLLRDAEKRVGVTIFSRGSVSKLFPPSMFEEIAETVDASNADASKNVLYQVVLSDLENAVFPWVSAQQSTELRSPLLGFA